MSDVGDDANVVRGERQEHRRAKCEKLPVHLAIQSRDDDDV